MNSPAQPTKSRAAQASWVCLLLAIGSTLFYLVICSVQSIISLDSIPHGVAGTILFIPLAGQAVAIFAGVISFFLIRQQDLALSTMTGIVARNICGIVLGLCVGVYMYFLWAMLTFGF